MGARLLAHPLTGALAAFTAADGLLVPAATDAPRADRRVDIELLVDAQVPENTVVVLGCDPALALLGAHLTRRYPTLRLVWVPRSSLTALRMLGRGEAHAAGTHLWDPESGESNMPYVRRELAGHRLVVVTLSQWQQGLIVAPGNPKGITGPADLARPEITLVNRDAGSGSRMLCDVWLRQAGIAPAGCPATGGRCRRILPWPKRWRVAGRTLDRAFWPWRGRWDWTSSPSRRNATIW